MNRYMRHLVIAAACALGPIVAAQEPLDQLTSAEIANGERLFNAHCAICHSIGGTGGRGPNLTIQPFRRVASDDALVAAVNFGIPGTEMPAAWALNAEESRQIAGYVRSLAAVEHVELPGDPTRGRLVYEASDCTTCHIVNGQGRGIGPELTDIGRRRSAGYLERALVRPAQEVPEGFLLILAASEGGTPVEGMRVNEDSFSVQLRDINGAFHSLRKSELTTFRKQFNRTLMPEYASKLSREELDDLIAYMASLRGE